LQSDFFFISILIIFIIALQQASKTLMEAISEVYEPQWTGAETLYHQVSNIDALMVDFMHKMNDQVMIPLNTYTAQFPEMRVSESWFMSSRNSE
jgi:amphiphysin